MGLNDKINKNFEVTLDKSKSEIWNAADAKIKEFRWTELLLNDSIDYREFEIKDDTIQVFRRPRFFDPFRPIGRIIYEMDENGILKWQVRPLDNIAPILLFFYILALAIWTISLLIVAKKDIWGTLLFLLFSWTLPGLMFYFKFKLDQHNLIEYGHRIVKEITD